MVQIGELGQTNSREIIWAMFEKLERVHIYGMKLILFKSVVVLKFQILKIQIFILKWISL